MATFVGLLIGVLATVAISHYYFRRTVNKRVSVYLILRNRVLGGIDDAVRKQLKFHFGTEEVTELYQIEFIVANDGERAVSKCLEPLSLRLPTKVKLLDSTILHRSPKDLSVIGAQETTQGGRTILKWIFPLLNKGDFFVVKLLLNGDVEEKQLLFHILADDLPRSLTSTWLPSAATKSEGSRIEWPGVIGGGVFLVVSAALTYCCYLLIRERPWMIPYPWTTFHPSWIDTPAVSLSFFGLFFLIVIGCVLIFSMGFEGFFRRHPKFPLPAELRNAGYRFMSEKLTADVTELSDLEDATVRAQTRLSQLKEPNRDRT